MTTPEPPRDAALHACLQRMPKVLLHEHLDGGLRIDTLFELLQAQGLEAPAASSAGLAAWLDDRAHAGSLVEFLRGFALTVAAMASPEAQRRVAFEAAEDAREDGCVLAEFRIAPLLFEDHGVSGEAAVEALLEGLSRSALPCGLIVCAMRHLPPEETARAARLAVRYRDRGANRIGHGVRLADALGDPARAHLVDDVRALALHLEVCPTSNVHTGAARSIAAHPIAALWHAGVSLSFHTDNRLMSRITHTDEAAALVREAGLAVHDLVAMGLQAARSSFLPESTRAAAAAKLDAWAQAQRILLA